MGQFKLPFGRWFVAEAERLLGNPVAAEERLVALWGDFRQSGNRAPWMGAHDLALLYCDQERWREAEHWLALAAEDPPPLRGTYISAVRPAVMARIAAQRGEFERALTLARQATDVADETEWSNARARVWLARAEVLRTSGQAEEAETALGTAVGIYQQKGNIAAAAQVKSARPR